MIYYAFYAAVALIALWFVIAGFISFKTQHLIIYIGDKPIEFKDRKAIIVGIFIIAVGVAFLTYATHMLYEH